MIRHIAATLLLLPVAAVADCPVAADLETGIEIRYADDSSEIYNRLGDEVVMVSEGGADPTWRNLLARGVFVLQLASLEEGRVDPAYTTNITYPVPLADLSLPVPGGTAIYHTVTNEANFATISTETQTHSYGEAGSLVIGDCSYGMIPMDVTYSGAGDWATTYIEEIGYLPDLGIGVLLSFREEGDDELDTFEPVSIRAVGG